MKKLCNGTILLLAVIFIASCNKDILSEDYTDCLSQSEEDAIVSNLRKQNSVGEETLMRYMRVEKNIEATRASELDIVPVLREQDTIMYLVNYADGGWELLSADKRVPTRLMISEDGSITLDEILEHPGVSILFDDMAQRIYDVKHSNMTEPVTYKGVIWDNIDYLPETTRAMSWVQIGKELVEQDIEETPHLIPTKWGQSTHNDYVPYKYEGTTERTVTGCVIVAAAQMLAYLHRQIGAPNNSFFLGCTCDTKIPGAADTNGQTKYGIFIPNTSQYTNLFWQHIVRDEGTNLGGIFVTKQTKQAAISTLMAYLGYLLDATYKREDGHYGTGAVTADLKDVFSTYYDINCIFKQGYDSSLVLNYILYRKEPVIIASRCEEDAGHCWIIDGGYSSYKLYNYNYIGTDPSRPSDPPQFKTVQLAEYDEYILMNWGWPSYKDIDDAKYVNYDDWEVPDGKGGYSHYDHDTRLIYGFTAK